MRSSMFAWAEIWLIWLVFFERKTLLNGWLIWLIISSEQAVSNWVLYSFIFKTHFVSRFPNCPTYSSHSKCMDNSFPSGIHTLTHSQACCNDQLHCLLCASASSNDPPNNLGHRTLKERMRD